MQLMIIRHGESVNNLPDTSLHTIDPDLTELGCLQARLLGERCRDMKIDAIISSPLRRALRTANEISIRKGNMPVHVYNDMVETGTDYIPMAYEKALDICPNVQPYEIPMRGGDYLDGYELDFNDPDYTYSRAYRVISRVKQTFPEDARVALIAHGSFNQKLIAAALRVTVPPNFVFMQENTAVTIVRYTKMDDGRVVTRLVKMNDTSHFNEDCEEWD